MVQAPEEGFFIEEDPEVVKKLFGAQKDDAPEDNFATIRVNQPEKIAKRAPAAKEREQPSFPKKENERDLITFTPSRPKGAFARMLRERIGFITASLASLCLIGGIVYIVYAVVGNYI